MWMSSISWLFWSEYLCVDWINCKRCFV